MESSGQSLFQEWGQAINDSFRELGQGFIDVIPNIIVAVVIFLAGWIIGSVLGRLVTDVIRMLKVDNLFRSLGAEEALARGGFKLDTGRFVGALVKWFIIIAFLVASAETVGLQPVSDFLRDVLGYIPNIIVAAIILIIAAFLAEALQRLVTGSARAAGAASAPFMGGIVRWVVWVVAILAVLSHLGIAGDFANWLFMGLVGMLALAGGLAFGLGGRDAASRYIERLRRDITE